MLIAAVQGATVLVFSAQSTVESQAVAERVSALPAESRWLSVATSDADVDVASAAPLAIHALQQLSGRAINQHLVFGPLADRRGGRMQLVASDALQQELRLVSGRWPKSCASDTCETVIVGDGTPLAPAGITIVGRATFADGSGLRPGLADDAPVLAGADASGLLAVPRYRAVPHALQWLSDIDTRHITSEGIGNYIKRVLHVSDELSLRDARLRLTAPTTQLSASAEQVHALQQRMLGLALCLILICNYAVHRIALARRAEFRTALRRAQEHAWSRNQQAQFSLATAVLVIAPGLVLGSLLGAGAGLVLFGMHGTPATTLWIWTAAFGITGVIAMLTALVATGVWRVLAMALCFAAWVAMALAKGYDLEVLQLATAGALAAALVARFPIPWRVSPFSLNLLRANAPRLRAVTVVAGFLVAFVMGSLASLETLQQGVVDSAVFESPLATRVAWGDRLPLQDRSLHGFETMTDGGTAFSVHTARASVRQSLIEATPIQVLGIESAVWSKLPDITGQTGIANARITASVRAERAVPGVVTAGATTLTGRASGLVATVALSVWLLDQDGEAQQRTLDVGADGAFRLDLNPTTVALLGFALDELPQAAAHRAHAVGEGISTLTAPHGLLRIRDLALDGIPMDLTSGMPSSGPARATGNSLQWQYSLVGGAGRAPLVSAPDLHGVVDPLTASLAQDGVLAVRFSDDNVVPVRVSAVANRLPTAGPRFLLLDDGALMALLAAVAPESLRVSEVWLTKPISSAALAADPLTGLSVSTHAGAIALRAGSSANAWSTRTLELFVGLGALLFLAFLGMSIRDILTHAELEGWAAQGLPRSRMERAARLALVALVAAAASSVLAVLLALFPVVLGRANIDITGSPAVPPLHATVSAPLLLLVLLCTLVLAAIASLELHKPLRTRGGQ